MSNDIVESLAAPAGNCQPLTSLLRVGAWWPIGAAILTESEEGRLEFLRSGSPTPGSIHPRGFAVVDLDAADFLF